MSAASYKIVDVNESNIEEIGLFCQQSKKKSEGYRNKVKWIKDRFKEGLHYKLLLVDEGKRDCRPRGFIEYIPSEYSWRGVDAKGYMVIHCIWVVGRNKKKGYGTKLLEECLKDSKGMNGVAVVTSDSGGWLPKNGLFIKHGFEKVDAASPNFGLYVKRFSKSASLPKFNPISKTRHTGIMILLTHQCPYFPQVVNVIKKVGEKTGIPVETKLLTNCKEAQKNGVHPYGTYCVLLNGEVLTYKGIAEKEIIELLQKMKQK